MEDPFVLASQVRQCFYIQDPFNANRNYVMKTVPRDFFFFNLQEQSESNAQQSFLSEPSDHALNLSENDENCEIQLVRNDMH